MIRFFYDPKYKYTNRTLIDVTGDATYRDVNYKNVDTPDTINGHIIYSFGQDEVKVPTYMIEFETVNNAVVYGRRWFVSGITPLSANKKFQISVLRDILSETDFWKSEEAYISAGLAPLGNYNKYKKWGLPFTNTKLLEQKLTINGKSSFFVFYVNEQDVQSHVLTESDLNIQYMNIHPFTQFDYSVDGISSIPSAQYINRTGNNVGQVFGYHNQHLRLSVKDLYGDSYIYSYYPEDSRDYIQGAPDEDDNYIFITRYMSYLDDNVDNSRNNLITAINNYLSDYNSSFSSTISLSAVQDLQPYVNKIILDTATDKVYRLRHDTQRFYPDITYNGAPGTLRTSINNIFGVNSANGNWCEILTSKVGHTYYLQELGTEISFNFNFIANVRKLPKSAVRCVNIVSDNNFSDNEIAQCLMLAQANPGNEGDLGRILDVQFLPFSIATAWNSNIKINNTACTAKFLEADDYYYYQDLTDLDDVHKETDTIKIVSPSRASQFIFSPYNNDGNMIFHERITLSPYSSVIYVRPSTLGLLEYDWDDKDCLIIQEDFSLTTITSAWTQYIYQNKNYQNTFNRQIQGREFERSWERKIEIANIPQERWNSRLISGDKARAVTGDLPIISSVAAGIAQFFPDQNYLAAAQLDRDYNEAMHQESISLAKDLFTYQLDNIKSQPLIPSKITTIDCKLLDGVYLEFYSTNPTELAAIDSFYKYNGNRIDDYGTFENYWGWFVRGKIIRSKHYTQPEIKEVNLRLQAGIFTGETYD